jgi:hypothetical protein
VLKTQLNAKKQGYADVIYLDAVENKYVEEVSSCNIFVVKVRILKISCASSLAVGGRLGRRMLLVQHFWQCSAGRS